MKDQRTGIIGIERRGRLLEMIATGSTAGEIAAELDVNPETIRKFARKRCLKIQRQPMRGANHPCWRGGIVLDRSGYALVRVAVAGPYGYLIRAIQRRGKAGTDPNGYAPEHRIVMDNQLGRRLRKGEVVDHIDGDVTNNSPTNLRALPSNAAHLKATLTGKVPNWTPEGKARMTGRPPKNRGTDLALAPTAVPSKNDGQE